MRGAPPRRAPGRARPARAAAATRRRNRCRLQAIYTSPPQLLTLNQPTTRTRAGGVFVIAKHEFTGKLETVAASAARHALLDDLVAAGRADGSVVVKNSPARNLHRLLGSLAFISAIFRGLLAGKPLKDAVSGARRVGGCDLLSLLLLLLLLFICVHFFLIY